MTTQLEGYQASKYRGSRHLHANFKANQEVNP
jgi:hypothetical protein